MTQRSQFLLFAAWVLSLAAFVTTLYLSQILHWPVCHLCWYQRLAIYPLVIILGIGAYNNEQHCIQYALPFPVLGFCFASYQYLEQMIPGFKPLNLCGPTLSCSDIHIKLAGFITLPLMSAALCLVIIATLIASKRG